MLEKVQTDRLAKLEKIRELGIDPYGWRYDSAEPIAEILARFKDDAEQSADAAGRLILMRKMGKNLIFGHIRDQNAQMQIALSKKHLDETSFQLAKLLDLGDIVGVAGELMRTKTGEMTIWATRLTLLCKSLNPMPEKFHGLTDTEIRYRQRYLDLMTHPETMANFRRRVEIIEYFRSTLKNRGFLEVETPMLQSIYGGAAARPFTTHHNTLDIDLFMRISPELYLKRLLVGGMEKVFEINRNFRNEGIDTSHNPEFTMMELYQAYADYEVMMEITEELIAGAAEEVGIPGLVERADRERRHIAFLRESESHGPEAADAHAAECEPIFEAERQCRQGRIVLPFGKRVIDYTRPWRRATYADLLQEHAGVAIDDLDGIRARARELGLDEAGMDDAIVTNEVFEITVEPHLIQPTFVKDYPAALCPLTRRDPENPDIALRFEPFAANMELGNAYTELNDPAIQEENFSRQLAGEDREETMRVMDEDFVTALRHGMPPAGGLGIGIDRVIMLLTNTLSIRDVVLFPLLRPEAKTPQ